jgi:hypothetical protein
MTEIKYLISYSELIILPDSFNIQTTLSKKEKLKNFQRKNYSNNIIQVSNINLFWLIFIIALVGPNLRMNNFLMALVNLIH